MRSRRTTTTWVAAATALTIYVWIASGVRTFTGGAEIVVGVPILAAYALAASWRSEAHLTDDGPTRPMTWVLLLVTLGGWELLELFMSPHDDHPTISSLGDSLLAPRIVRAAAFGAWLFLGWRIARRQRA